MSETDEIFAGTMINQNQGNQILIELEETKNFFLKLYPIENLPKVSIPQRSKCI